MQQSKGLQAIALDQRIQGRHAEVAQRAAERGAGRGAHQVRWRGQQRLSIPENGRRPRLGIVELHAVVELVILQTSAGSIHRRGRGGDDVDDRRLGGHQPWTHRRLTHRILGHERIRITLLRQQYGHGAGADDDAAAADRDEQIGSCGARRLHPLLHGRKARVLIHGIEGPGIQRPKLIPDASQQIGLMRHRLPADDKGVLGPGATDLVGQMIERVDPDVQAPWEAHGSKRV